ncbi:MAG: UMP kinase [Planctomycetota bacterium]
MGEHLPTDRPARVLLKLSGEAFSRESGFGIDAAALGWIAEEVKAAWSTGVQIAVVVGGGNIIRGKKLADSGDIEQATADYMGMLGTIMNGLALREKLQSIGVDSRIMSALEVRSVAEPFIRNRAIRHLEKDRVVVLSAGIGNPFFTTDTCAALRATELRCDMLLKATTVDGIYTADPKKVPEAERLDSASFDAVIQRGLAVMDATAFTLCRERNIPIRVFKFDEPGNIKTAASGKPIGTLVSQQQTAAT